MDSINQQQPEENRKDMRGAEAIDKLKELAEKAGTCFFCTDIRTGKPFAARPMAIQEVDDSGTIFFLSADDSDTNAHIAQNDHVQLLFQGNQHSDMMSIYGRATISKDKGKIAGLWKPIFKTWFTEGENDPRITVIGVSLEEGYYWDTKHGNLVAFAKQLAGALTGQTLDDSIEGHLRK
jgi:general stress protein 26